MKMRAWSGLFLLLTSLLAAPTPVPAQTPSPGDIPLEPPLSSEDLLLLQRFRHVWHGRKAVFQNRFLGIPTLQNPFDFWIIQELISEVKPDWVVEAGTYRGGSAIAWAMLLRQVNPAGRVITIDIEDRRTPQAKEHPISRRRVDFLLGSSTAPEIVAQVHERVGGQRALVILDSLHTAEHVADELEAYAPLVPVGSYVVVQDTLPSSIRAVKAFVSANDRFVADHSRERFLITNTVNGYLKRVK